MAKKATQAPAKGGRGRKKTIVKSTPAKAVSQKYPAGVVDQSAYDEYQAIQQSDLYKCSEITTSDPNTTINLKGTNYIIRKMIAHLPQEEQENILAQATVVRKLQGKVSSLKRKAFNIKQFGPYSWQESVLDDRAAELLEYFGRFYSAAEVHRIVTTEWGFDVNYTTIDNFRKRHIDRIKEKQEEYKRDYSDIRLGHKRSRLDELQYLYSHRKAKYESTSSKEDYKLLLQTIEQIRKEVEGDKLTIDGHLTMDVEHTVNLHIQNEVLKHVVINDIIVARLAAKLSVDSRVLINKLHKSYYAKFTGFGTTVDTDFEEVPIYPSKFVYNFDDLNKQNEQLKLADEQFKESLPVLSEDTKSHMVDVKAALLEKIRQKKNQISVTQDRANNQKPD